MSNTSWLLNGSKLPYTVFTQSPAIQAAQLSILAGVSDILTKSSDIEQMLNDVLGRCLADAGTAIGAVYLVEPDGCLQLRAQIGYTSAQRLLLAHFFGYCSLIHQAMAASEPLAVPSAQVPEHMAEDLLRRASAGSLLITPLIAGDARLGVVIMALAQRDLDNDWMTFTKAVGYQISQAIALGQTVAQLVASEQRYRNLVQDVDAIVWELDVTTGYFTFVSQRAEELLGYPVKQWYTEYDFWATHVHLDDRDQVVGSWQATISEGRGRAVEHRAITADGRVIWVRDIMHVVVDARGQVSQLRGLMIDMTEQKHLEEQFHQSQKMEALGRLAGGVAHDFNNLLTAITGYSEFLLNAIDQTDPRWGDVDQIRHAADRAAQLTRQLLVSSRQQILAPQLLDLNAVVTRMAPMLRRLIGEDIDLLLVLGLELGRVKADSGQIEQVILNLIVNARDAMPSGGKITIETARTQVDPVYTGRYAFVAPGPYVLLAASDTGCGMAAHVRSQIFEPFFTTKEPGKGTGLGLSTVYGIIRQCGGDIFVDSKLGAGTTFKIYLPEVDAVVEPPQRQEQITRQVHGSETVLLVEDEEGVRTLVQKILQRRGYMVLAARHAAEAIEIAEGHAAAIDLLLTDVVMPGMRGPELAAYLLPLHRAMRVLYMSGYTDSMIEHAGILDANVMLIQKPFTPDELAERLRQILDAR